MKLLNSYPNLFSYQRKAIEKGIYISKRDNGYANHSQTGLGKTIIMATIAINLTEKPILIVSPKSMQSNWKNALEGYDYVVATKTKIPEGEYGCVIVDEAHQFQNVGTKSYMTLFKIIHSLKCPALLATATPFQNNPEGMKFMYGLIYFNQNSLSFNALGYIASSLSKNYKIALTASKYGETMDTITKEAKHLHLSKHDAIMFGQAISTFSDRATWKQIKEEYPNDMSLMGGFPEMNTTTIDYDIDSTKLNNTIELIRKMPFALQNEQSYFGKKENNGMEGIFKCLLMKRLDSSIASLKETCNEMIKGIEARLKDIVEDELNVIFLSDLNKDLESLNMILSIWDGSEDTNKFEKVYELANSIEGKVIIFTEYIPTFERLREMFGENALSYSGNSSEKDIEEILNVFDPSKKGKSSKRILICTDAFSEGVSLHEANNIIHFDLRYNPFRVEQRNGRINRIGNKHSNVNIYSFGVPSLIEGIIKLEDKIDRKYTLYSYILEGMNAGLELENSECEIGKVYATNINFFKGYIAHTNIGAVLIKSSFMDRDYLIDFKVPKYDVLHPYIMGHGKVFHSMEGINYPQGMVCKKGYITNKLYSTAYWNIFNELIKELPSNLSKDVKYDYNTRRQYSEWGNAMQEVRKNFIDSFDDLLNIYTQISQ